MAITPAKIRTRTLTRHMVAHQAMRPSAPKEKREGAAACSVPLEGDGAAGMFAKKLKPPAPAPAPAPGMSKKLTGGGAVPAGAPKKLMAGLAAGAAAGGRGGGAFLAACCARPPPPSCWEASGEDALEEPSG